MNAYGASPGQRSGSRQTSHYPQPDLAVVWPKIWMYSVTFAKSICQQYNELLPNIA
jgi:hypothetical protein